MKNLKQAKKRLYSSLFLILLGASTIFVVSSFTTDIVDSNSALDSNTKVVATTDCTASYNSSTCTITVTCPIASQRVTFIDASTNTPMLVVVPSANVPYNFVVGSGKTVHVDEDDYNNIPADLLNNVSCP